MQCMRHYENFKYKGLIMSVIECNFDEPHFSDTKIGKKKVEGRPNLGKFKDAKIGDILRISRYSAERKGSYLPTDAEYEVIERKIVEVKIYPTFQTYLEEHLKIALPRVDSVDAGVTLYRSFGPTYSAESEKDNGVIAIFT